jgi:hypothetical protein
MRNGVTVNDMPFSMFGYTLLLQPTILPNLHLDMRKVIARPIPTTDARLYISQVYKFEPHSFYVAQQIISDDTLAFIAQQAPSIQPILHQERRRLALAWLDETWRRMIELMDWHCTVGRYHFRMSTIDEVKLFWRYGRLRIACAALNNILRRDSQKAAVPLAYLIAQWSEELWTRYTNWLIEFDDFINGTFEECPDNLVHIGPETHDLFSVIEKFTAVQARVALCLAPIDSDFGRLASLSVTCDLYGQDDRTTTGENRLDDFVLRLCHDRLFRQLAFRPIASFVGDLERYLCSLQNQPDKVGPDWFNADTYRQLLPAFSCQELLKEMFLSNVRVGLISLQANNGGRLQCLDKVAEKVANCFI